MWLHWSRWLYYKGGAAKAIDLSQETKKCTLEVIGVTAFGYSFGCFKKDSKASEVG